MLNNPNLQDFSKTISTTSIYRLWQKYVVKAGAPLSSHYAKIPNLLLRPFNIATI